MHQTLIQTAVYTVCLAHSKMRFFHGSVIYEYCNLHYLQNLCKKMKGKYPSNEQTTVSLYSFSSFLPLHIVPWFSGSVSESDLISRWHDAQTSTAVV